MMKRLSKKQEVQLWRILAHIGSLIPLVLLIWGFYTNQLGADPLRELTFRTGKPALILLTLSLACTPLSMLGWKTILPLRKTFGLYAFLYVCLHLGIFIFSYGYIGQGIDWAFVWQEATMRRYALVGLAAFVILVPLAATSFNWAMRKLGKNWKRLHRLVYLAIALAVIHYWWLVKGNYTQPALFAVLAAGLLLFRLPPIKERIQAWQRRRTKKKRQAAV